jgi:TatD DNase family protein
MIDTHSHLYYPDFAADLDQVIERARSAGVERIITAGVDRATSAQCLAIAARYPGVVFAAIGMHPSEVDSATEDDLLWIEAMAGDPAVVAIGEIGLDIYRGETNLARQEVVFTRLLGLARQTALPVIVHHRAAGTRTIEIIEAEQITRGVFHCFSEDESYARRVLATGLNVSFTGNLTYKNSPLPDLARRLPLERTLLETDAPFMAPVPFRGRRCEPAHVRQVALKQAELHGVELDEVDRLTTQAASALFFGQTVTLPQ